VWWARDRTRVFPLYLLLWSSSRFIIEFFREPAKPGGGIGLAQWACLGVFALGIYLYIKPVSEVSESPK
ncbi:MAG: prolipoprotein diacylglyceryl transferase family protein, partial [Armatimonadota bacterium]